jgi:hypothetical protein
MGKDKAIAGNESSFLWEWMHRDCFPIGTLQGVGGQVVFRYSNSVSFSGVDNITVAVINICLLPYFNVTMANCVYLRDTTL